MPDEARGRAADTIADQDPVAVSVLIGAVQELGLWSTLLPVVRTMGEESRTRLAAMDAFHDEAVIRAIVVAAADEDCWVDLAPLLRVLPDDAMESVQAVVAGLPQPTLTTMLGQAMRGRRHPASARGHLFELDDAGVRRIVEVVDDADGELTRTVVQLREDPPFADLVDQVPVDIMAAVDRAAALVG